MGPTSQPIDRDVLTGFKAGDESSLERLFRERFASLTDLAHRTFERDKFARHLLVGDRVVGLWDWSPKHGRVVVGTFAPLAKAVANKVRTKADTLGAFIRDELGHARWVSVETDDEVQRRADHVVAKLNAV